jgi:acetyl esterase/lipase
MIRRAFPLVLAALIGCGPPPKTMPSRLLPPEDSSLDHQTVPEDDDSRWPDGPIPPSGEPDEISTRVVKEATLPEARKGFQTKLIRRESANLPVEQPPADLFRVVKYPSPAGELAAYMTPDPKDGKKRPAIVWVGGGDCNTITDVWSEQPEEADESASQFRQAGVVMMFPSLRGGNQNPGVREGFFGEVDDVIAAGEFLRAQPHVDPARVYLGGHSTGGSLVLLVAAASDKYRAVFSFGPVGTIATYDFCGPKELVPCGIQDAREIELRGPNRWVNTIRVPTYVFEGTRGTNIRSLQWMAEYSTNSNVKYLPIKRADHFSLLAPMNTLIAKKILNDTGEKTNLTFSGAELAAVMKK